MFRNTIQKILLLSAVCATAPAMADWPIALADDVIIHRSTSIITINPLKNDIGTRLSIDSTNFWTEKGGRASLNFTASRYINAITYKPPTNGFVGVDTFWYVMIDDQGRKNAAKITVTIKPLSSRLPDPQNDVVSVQKDKTIRIAVLENDVFQYNSGEITQYNAWSQNGGQITKIEETNQTTQLSYTPRPGFVGTDTFWYAVKGIYENSNLEHAAKVTINVTENNSAGPYPQAKPETIVTRGRVCDGGRNIVCTTTTFIYPTHNDIGNNLKILLPSSYSLNGAKLRIVQEGDASPRIVHSPPPNFVGEDKIWYIIEDEVGRRNWGEITLDVRQ